MILADSEILDHIRKKKLIVENFNEGNLTPNGYDLTVGEILVPSLGARADKGTVRIPTFAWFLIGTREVVDLPRGITGQLWIRTSWARKGIMSSFGKVDAGFRGNLTLSAFNASPGAIELSVGDRFAQIIFMKTSREAEKDYQERSGNYQDERGITLEPRKKSS